MIAKKESNLWKSFRKSLKDGDGYVVSRLESYVTPGFPDCLVFHNTTGFFTVELKVIQSNNKVKISPFQIAWNMRHSQLSAPVFIMVGGLSQGHVKLFSGSRIKDLGTKYVQDVPGIYEGRLEDLDLSKLLNSQTPKSPNSTSN